MRMQTMLVAAALAVAACGDSATAPPAPESAAPLLAAASGAVPDAYIVVLREGADPAAVAAVAGVQPRRVYSAALNGFAATLNRGQLAALRHHTAVEYVEQDQELRLQPGTAALAPLPPPWGLDRINQRHQPLDLNAGTGWPSAGNVHAYIIDTGLMTSHTEFGGRAQNVYGTVFTCTGYGTHVAGIVGGSTYGVVKGVQLRGLQVVSCSGSASSSDVIAAVDWVRSNAVRPAVATISVGGGYSASLNAAVDDLAASGVFVAVGSGNGSADACGYSPGSAANATTVNASNRYDQRASFSNYGGCTHLYAPGVDIPSAWDTSTTATNTLSGTAMAAAHVAGVGAQYLAGDPTASSAAVRAWIVGRATPNVIIGNPPGTPNLLLYR